MRGIQKTFSIKESEVSKKWYLIDAEGKVLGRLATQIALILRGKNKPEFTPSMDMGDNVIVINAEKIVLTGSKSLDKEYFRHSQYPGGKKFISITKIMAEEPEFVINNAVKGMLPKTKLSKSIIKNLKIYAGPEHPHAAQKPEKIEL
ncbi:MAG TPA: 50S ribosomal protein L13 [Spirochaetota bacterium]|mgnify:CR=1 FL=1|nr:50S ribosomal protein L13 [Spirochaetota bacterium]HPI89120.1 50S ribosomal protein L13 [Spirochaetota bacterium]HPR48874.1 50S ribosomal protein L13 [Spirochaetota bacterium]